MLFKQFIEDIIFIGKEEYMFDDIECIEVTPNSYRLKFNKCSIDITNNDRINSFYTDGKLNTKGLSTIENLFQNELNNMYDEFLNLSLK